MKIKEREEAVRLRKELGLSLKEIAKKINVSKGSVSRWVNKVELTEFQKEKLNFRQNFFSSKKWKNINFEIRKEYQNDGAKMMESPSNLFLSGCMLYWAEGAKDKNSVRFSNSDPDMIFLFVNFLKECFFVEKNEIKISINCYNNNGISVEEIENFWIKLTNLNRENLNKTIVNNLPISSSKKSNKLLYGVCKIIVNNTKVVQKIYGAINKFSNTNNYKWIG